MFIYLFIYMIICFFNPIAQIPFPLLKLIFFSQMIQCKKGTNSSKPGNVIFFVVCLFPSLQKWTIRCFSTAVHPPPPRRDFRCRFFANSFSFCSLGHKMKFKN